MAQASRSSSVPLSDDPIENASTWLQMNSKLIGGVVGGAAVVGLLVFGYRSYSAGAREKASIALYAAQEPFAQGKMDEARTALQSVVSKHGGTAAGSQAAILLVQLFYEKGEYDAGIKAAEQALGGTSADFRASLEALVAAGHEMKGNWNDAATRYGKAAAAAQFASDKQQYQAAQARSLTSAGKTAEARVLWEALAAMDGTPVQQEANVRLGELSVKK